MAFLGIATTTVPYEFYFPGHANGYLISSEIVVPFIPRSAIKGDGPGVTRFIPATTNGCFRFNTSLTWGMTFSDFSIEWAASETNTNSIGFRYGSANIDTFFLHTYENIDVINSYRAWSTLATLNSLSIWGMSWKNCHVTKCKNSGWYLASAVANGQPELSFDHCFVENTGVGSPASTGSAFYFQACEVSMTNIGIEGWYDNALTATAGGYCVINNIHIESHVFNADSVSAFSVTSTTSLSIDGVSIAGATTANNNTVTLMFEVGDGAMLTPKNVQVLVNTTLGSSYIREVFWLNNITSRTIVAENVRVLSGGINNIFSGGRATQSECGLIHLGQLPTSSRVAVAGPIFRIGGTGEALPAASITNHGEIRFVKGAPGVADTLSICRKDAANAYAWVTLF